MSIILGLTSCKQEKLFWIDRDSGTIHDFIYMVDSMNIPAISGDSLKYILTSYEIDELRKPENGNTNDSQIFSVCDERDFWFCTASIDRKLKIVRNCVNNIVYDII